MRVIIICLVLLAGSILNKKTVQDSVNDDLYYVLQKNLEK